MRRHPRKNCARGGPDGPRLARHADQRQHDRAAGARFAALHRADFRPQRAGHGSGRARAQAVRRAQARGSRRCRDRPEGEGFFLHSVAFLAHDCLQGLAARAADHRFLQGAAGSRSDQRAVPGAPALFHQHVSELEAGASVPLHLPQRRNQHAARKHELDVRAAIRAGVSAVWRRHEEAAADHHAGRQRLGHAGQRRGAADACRPQPAARDVHADSGSLGSRRHHARGRQGVLRISRVADGAVGRPGGGGVHRRARDRREARSQRTAPRPLPGHHRWPGGAGLGSGRAARSSPKKCA